METNSEISSGSNAVQRPDKIANPISAPMPEMFLQGQQHVGVNGNESVNLVTRVKMEPGVNNESNNLDQSSSNIDSSGQELLHSIKKEKVADHTISVGLLPENKGHTSRIGHIAHLQSILMMMGDYSKECIQVIKDVMVENEQLRDQLSGLQEGNTSSTTVQLLPQATNINPRPSTSSVSQPPIPSAAIKNKEENGLSECWESFQEVITSLSYDSVSMEEGAVSLQLVQAEEKRNGLLLENTKSMLDVTFQPSELEQPILVVEKFKTSGEIKELEQEKKNLENQKKMLKAKLLSVIKNREEEKAMLLSSLDNAEAKSLSWKNRIQSLRAELMNRRDVITRLTKESRDLKNRLESERFVHQVTRQTLDQTRQELATISRAATTTAPQSNHVARPAPLDNARYNPYVRSTFPLRK